MLRSLNALRPVFHFDWWELRKLKQQRRELQKKFALKAKEYKQDKAKTHWDFAELEADEYYEGITLEETENAFRSNRLIQNAIEFDVEIPPTSEKEFWQFTDDGENCYLNSKGRALVRDLVHKEQERAFEEWAKWVKMLAPIIGALAALVGAATGLVLALKR